jgi:glycosyltransferase involved in cell wall biosynthesis
MRIILHITPHLGGGVGRVLLNYLEEAKGNPSFVHKVLCLDYANDTAISAAMKSGFALTANMSSNHTRILSLISEADVILIHWWNHPLLNAFLVRETLPPARVIIWSHISGFHSPYVFSEPILQYPDLFVFTTPLSLDVHTIKNLPEERQKALRVIWSTGGVKDVASVQPQPHVGFRIGYIGTVDYGKMHPRFLEMCGNIKVPDAQFVVCGGPREKEIQKAAVRMGIGERFVFTGQVNDIAGHLSTFDVFGYPLAPYHYGTGEQSLGESMAAGVPPVVLANRTESYIVDDGITGIVAKDEEAYERAIEKLYRDPGLRYTLSENARESARQRYSLELMCDRWDTVFRETLNLPKRGRSWTGTYRGQSATPAEIYLESLGEQSDEFSSSFKAHTEREQSDALDRIRRLYETSHLWRSDTRGTPRQYRTFYPDDRFLRLWSDLAKS